jgi:cell division protein FtsB
VDRAPGDETRVEELLRLNAELAAELRSLRRGAEGRSAPVPAARRIARLVDDLESTRAKLASETAAAEATRAALAAREEELGQLRRAVEELRREVTRLRSGLPGFLRRARARLLRTR